MIPKFWRKLSKKRKIQLGMAFGVILVGIILLILFKLNIFGASNTINNYATLTYTDSGSNKSVVSNTVSTLISAVQPPGDNLALNKPASADSEESGHEAAKGNDGNSSGESRWAANDSNTGHWWKVDLGATSSLTGTVINWEQPAAFQYRIEVSTNNSTWTTVVNATSNTVSEQVMTDNFTASARYVRITVTGGLADDIWASFWEFEVYGTGGTPSPAPVASFSATPTSGNAPLAVQFTDTSTNTPTSWDWNFGDGTTHSTTKNPSHTYSTAGNYSVSLTVTNANGSDSLTKNNFITVNTPPASSLTVSTNLQGRSNNSATSVKLTVYSVGTSTVVFQKSDISINSSGNATFNVTGMTAGTRYDFVIKVSGYLTNRLSNQNFTSAMTVNFNQLKAGDFNNDNIVNTADFSIMLGQWGKNNVTCDINADAIVNTIDFTILSTNWSQEGQ